MLFKLSFILIVIASSGLSMIFFILLNTSESMYGYTTGHSIKATVNLIASIASLSWMNFKLFSKILLDVLTLFIFNLSIDCASARFSQSRS